MPRVTCRCGETITIAADAPDRVVCPRCEARIRVRRDPAKEGPGDGFLRFACPCGRRLKVRISAEGAVPLAGKCPDCGRVVPVPASQTSRTALATANPAETPTSELTPEEVALLERWSARYRANPAPATGPSAPREPAVPLAKTDAIPVATAAPSPPPPTATKAEAGFRICPRCGRPIHLGAVTCRECGTSVPKR